MRTQLPLPLNPAQFKLMQSVLEHIDQHQMTQLYLNFIHSETKETDPDESDLEPQNR